MELEKDSILYEPNILELNIPVLLAVFPVTNQSLKCIRCGVSLPSEQAHYSIVIPVDLDPTTSKSYVGWAICEKCSAELMQTSISLDVSTPEHPEVIFKWIDFLTVTLGVCLSEDHSIYDGVAPDKLPPCPICDSPVNPEVGHLVLGISYEGLPGRNFGAKESAWAMIHWDCSIELITAEAKMSFEYLDLFAKAIDREYKSSKESSDTTSKTDTDGVPK